MNWNNLTDQERIVIWRGVRSRAVHQDRDGVVEEMSQLISQLPLGYRAVDYHTPSGWPTPWEILVHNMTCPSSQALLVYYTLQLTGFLEGVELWLVDDYQDQYLAVILDGRYLMGYYPNELVDLEDTAVINRIKRFTDGEIKSIK